MSRGKKSVLLAVGDIHANAPDGPKLGGSDRQRWLAERFEVAWKLALKKYSGRRIVLGLGGEMVDLPGYENRVVAKEIVGKLVRAVQKQKGEVYGLLGTGYHVGSEGYEDRQVYDDLGVPSFEGRQFDLDGRWVWHAHHGLKLGGTWYTETDSLYRAAKNFHLRCKLEGERIPNLILAHHYHRSPADGVFDTTRAHIVPAWKLPDRYASQKVTWSKPSIGVSIYIPETNEIDRSFAYDIPTALLWA